MKAGDIIVAFNGAPVAKADKLRSRVAATLPGSDATIEVFRDGRRKNLEVEIGELPTDEQEIASSEETPKLDVGMSVRTLTPEIARELGYEGRTRGVIVTNVDPFGPAAKAGIRVNDVIVQVQDATISDAEDFRAQVRKHKGKGVRLIVKSGETQRFAYLEIG
jgi:S1-C subfamily serine protease